MTREAAIEAGARALYERQYPPNPESGWPRWENVAEQYREEPLRTAAAVLDAASKEIREHLLAVLRDDHDALLLHASAAAGDSPVRAQVLRDRAMGVRMAMERIAAL